MPGDQFSSTTLKIILNYFYTDSLILPSAPNEMLQTPKTSRLNEKKYELRLLQKVFDAGDFLGHFDTICLATLDRMSQICHEFKCICSDCAILLPSVLLFADKHGKLIPQLREQLIRLYADPLDSIAPLWSQKPFALLVNSMLMAQQPQATPAAASQASAVNNNGNSTSIINNTNASNSSANNKDRISSIFSKKAPNSSSSILSNENTSSDSGTAIDPPSNLITEITERTFSNISKHNSVRVLHSLHLCFSHLRTVDRFPTWSSAVHNILNTYLHHTVDMISSHFDYYCVEYPILLSCIDGIGFGFSVDFLGFVLGKVLTEGLHDNNATVIYQCIIKDLGGRQEMYKNVAVDGVLLDARTKVTQYIGKRWVEIKAEGGFLTMEKDFLRILAEGKNHTQKEQKKKLNFQTNMYLYLK
jgi:hypothetical protein